MSGEVVRITLESPVGRLPEDLGEVESLGGLKGLVGTLPEEGGYDDFLSNLEMLAERCGGDLKLSKVNRSWDKVVFQVDARFDTIEGRKDFLILVNSLFPGSSRFLE